MNHHCEIETIPTFFPVFSPYVHGFTTTRNGGHSQNQFSSLNFSFTVDDHPEHVRCNHQKLHQIIPNQPFWLQQVHGRSIIEVHQDDDSNIIKKGDVLITDLCDTVLSIQTADCLPILLYDRKQHIIAAIHSGWRGLSQSIINHTVHYMNAMPKDLLLWIGPGISQKHFICQEDVVHHFLHTIPSPHTWLQGHQEKTHIDLTAIARIQAQELGIEHIGNTSYCTYQHHHLFYSYRRDGAQTGRMATVIWQTKSIH